MCVSTCMCVHVHMEVPNMGAQNRTGPSANAAIALNY